MGLARTTEGNTPARPRTWDLFCHVIDNFGDIGVSWRLAAELAARGERVRLWTDDASALAWMAPAGADGVDVLAWTGRAGPDLEPGDVVIEAFGCEPPEAFVRRMAGRVPPPRWINVEYLSAEAFVERNHRLGSPRFSGPGAGLTRWFFYPGFAAATGGLIREADLLARQARFDRDAWLAAQGIDRRADEQVVNLFCYGQPELPALLDALAERPTRLLAAAGEAAEQIRQLLGPTLRRGLLRATTLPLLTQREFDHALWAGDLNFVRGEDSFVRAQWAGVPFVWQIYPQDDGAHGVKLNAFLDRFLASADAPLASPVRRLWQRWNGLSALTAPRPLVLPPAEPWRARSAAWRETLLAQPELVTELIRFASESG